MEFTAEEIEDIIKAMSQKPTSREEKAKIPLRPPGSYGKVSKVAFSPVDGEKPRPLTEITDKELSKFENLKINIEVLLGKTKLNLNEIAALKEGNLLFLDSLCDDPVEIYANGVKIGRGEVVTANGQFGVKIISFTRN